MTKLSWLLLPLLLGTPSTYGKSRISVAIQTPSSCEQIQISAIYKDQDSAVVVAKVFKPSRGAMCMMMMSNASDSVSLDNALPKSTQVVILGKDWCWQNPSESTGYMFIKTKQQLDRLTEGKTRVFTQALGKGVDYQGFNAGKNCN